MSKAIEVKSIKLKNSLVFINGRMVPSKIFPHPQTDCKLCKKEEPWKSQK